MVIGQLIVRYIVWHYTRAILDIARHVRRFAWFLWHFFSIGVLARTLISPWKRMDEDKKKKGIPDDLFERIVINTLMRIVGFLIRGATILAGLVAIVLEIVVGVIAVIVWIFLPFFVIGGLVQGFRMIFS